MTDPYKDAVVSLDGGTGGCRIVATLEGGTWDMYRGEDALGRVIATIVPMQPPAGVVERLALPFAGILPLIGTGLVTSTFYRDPQPMFVLVEREPSGTRVADLTGPLPVRDALAVGLDAARLVAGMHATGALHGSLRPQTTWIERVGNRMTMTGSTPRPELVGLHCCSKTRVGWRSPFFDDAFFPDVLVKDDVRSVSSDVAQLGMLVWRLVAGRSPFVAGEDESPMAGLVRAITGPIPPWPAGGDALTRELEEVTRAAFDPALVGQRALAPLLGFLEQYAR